MRLTRPRVLPPILEVVRINRIQTGVIKGEGEMTAVGLVVDLVETIINLRAGETTHVTANQSGTETVIRSVTDHETEALKTAAAAVAAATGPVINPAIDTGFPANPLLVAET